MVKKIGVCILFLSILMVGGCFKVYEELRIKSDLSGSISIKMEYDMNMIADGVMVFSQRNLSLLAKGDPTKKISEEEKAQIKRDMILPMIKMNMASLLKDKQTLQSQLGEGIKITEMNTEMQGDKILITLCIAFDHISRIKELEKLEIINPALQHSMGGKEGRDVQFTKYVLKNPLKGLTIEEKDGSLLLVQTWEEFKIEFMKDLPKETEEFLKKIEDAGFYFRIRFPYIAYEIQEHNAHKFDKNGHTLYWYYTVDKAQKWIKEGKLPTNITMKMKKKKN